TPSEIRPPQTTLVPVPKPTNSTSSHVSFSASSPGRLRTGATHPQRRTIIRQPRQPLPATTTHTRHRRRSHMDARTAMINRMLIYVNQLDPLVPNNEPTLEVWATALQNTDLHAAKKDTIDNYGTNTTNTREANTPGYLRQQARRIETSHNRDAVMSAEHDWNHRDTCAECKSEIAAGEREPSQQGQKVRQTIPPPDNVKQQLRQLLAAKDINQD